MNLWEPSGSWKTKEGLRPKGGVLGTGYREGRNKVSLGPIGVTNSKTGGGKRKKWGKKRVSEKARKEHGGHSEQEREFTERTHIRRWKPELTPRDLWGGVGVRRTFTLQGKRHPRNKTKGLKKKRVRLIARLLGNLIKDLTRNNTGVEKRHDVRLEILASRSPGEETLGDVEKESGNETEGRKGYPR